LSLDRLNLDYENDDHIFLVARLCFGSFLLITSAYCLLAHIPFTYHWFIKCTLLPWVRVFAVWHPVLYWLVLFVVAPTVAKDLRDRKTRRLVVGFLAFHAALGVKLLYYPVLPNLGNDATSLVWSLVLLLPLLWIAAIDHVGYPQRIDWTRSQARSHPTIVTSVLMGAFLSLLYIEVYYVRFILGATSEFGESELLFATSWSMTRM
jgi:hypothetical protein